MAGRHVIFERKMHFLQNVKENKEILFGAFSDRLKKTDKVEKWKELANLAKSVCLMPSDKDWTYARDTLWQNMKKTTMGKVDNARKSGTGGHGKMTDVDNMVLDILGKESPVIVGLGVPESFDVAKPLPQDSTSIEQPTILTQDPGVPSTSRIAQAKAHETKRKRSMTRTGEEISDDKKKEKLDLQIEHLKLQNYKTKLEILHLETALHLPRSEFTQCFGVENISYGHDEHTTYLNI